MLRRTPLMYLTQVRRHRVPQFQEQYERGVFVTQTEAAEIPVAGVPESRSPHQGFGMLRSRRTAVVDSTVVVFL